MYDPTIGRWISEDPIEFAGGDTNLYRYVHNGPANFTDPSGLFLDGPWNPVNMVNGFVDRAADRFVGALPDQAVQWLAGEQGQQLEQGLQAGMQQFEAALDSAVQYRVPFATVAANGYYGTQGILAAWNNDLDGVFRATERMPLIGPNGTAVVRNGLATINHVQNGDWAAADASLEAAILPIPVLGGLYGGTRQTFEIGDLVRQGRFADAYWNSQVFGIGFWTGNSILAPLRPNLDDPELQRAMNRGGAQWRNAELAIEIALALAGARGVGGGGRIIGPRPVGGFQNGVGGGLRVGNQILRGPVVRQPLPAGMGRGPQRPGIVRVWDPNRPVGRQLEGQGQLAGLRRNPNIRGIDLEALLKKTPNQLMDMVKNGELPARVLKIIKKAFENRDLRHGN
ncbi:MAG: RHS repeat-associated core domain-containing protein [Planctomycetes bacterium]|nr:RHS repeat-associated core domain-containing protein [Planctomycetota bacterium]